MGGKVELHLIPPAMDVRMVVFGFRERAYGIDERKRSLKILEVKCARNGLGVFGQIPVIDLGGEFECFFTRERRCSAFTGDTVLLVERGGHR